jgi:hypothetical protein
MLELWNFRISDEHCSEKGRKVIASVFRSAMVVRASVIEVPAVDGFFSTTAMNVSPSLDCGDGVFGRITKKGLPFAGVSGPALDLLLGSSLGHQDFLGRYAAGFATRTERGLATGKPFVASNSISQGDSRSRSKYLSF